ncbi:TetR/AcrR family transcriptional regulator [Gorillibacterium massiliense]|uniref:TetR/AcrR family transcriptional regulator n=1 Tax=Gorillibacterium massiliense TaxID=1280390 RepID=UPI0004B13626|nr:TetR/AcrR family transcriptional regulator [Gorillibacterium massiliense]
MNDKRKSIIDCAYKLFKEKGYLETSIQDILEASSISKGTFYKYFTSKGSLTLELLQQLQEKLNMELHILLLNDDVKDEEELIRKAICHIKNFESEHALRPIIGEAIIEKQPALLAFIKENRQKSLQWLYNRMKIAFGNRYPHGVLDATLFLQALIKELTKMNESTNQAIPIEAIVDSSFNKMLLCMEEMNSHPLFESERLIFQENSISNTERFMNKTLQLGQWLKKDFGDHPKKELFFEYLRFLARNREQLGHFPSMVNQMIQDFEQYLGGRYPAIHEYIQLLKNL